MSHQRCAGWLQGLSFLVVCREVVGHRRCAGCVVGGVWDWCCGERCGIDAVVDALWGEVGNRRCGGCSGMWYWRFLSKGFC